MNDNLLNEDMAEKAEKMRSLGIFAYLGCMIGFIVLSSFSLVGKSSFAFFGIKAIGFLIIGLVAIVASFLVSKYGSNKAKKGVIAYIIFGIIVILFGTINSSRFFKDLANGPESKVLYNAAIVKKGAGGKYKSTHYYLSGMIDGQKSEFDVTGLTANEREQIVHAGSMLKIVIYPNSKVISSYEATGGSTNTVDYDGDFSKNDLQRNPELIKESPIQYTPDTWPTAKSQDNSIDEVSVSDLSMLEDLIANSKLPYELLNDVTSFQDFSNSNRLYDSNADAEAYVGLYPLADKKMKITKIVIKGGDYNILGMKIGDDISNIASVLIQYTLASSFDSKELELYPCENSSGYSIFSKGDVKLFFFIDENQKIIEMRVIISDGDVMSLDYD